MKRMILSVSVYVILSSLSYLTKPPITFSVFSYNQTENVEKIINELTKITPINISESNEKKN